MNRGSRFRCWHLFMLNLTLSSVSLSHLKRLASTSQSFTNGSAPSSLLQPLPKFRLRPLPLKARLPKLGAFDKEVCPFSRGSLVDSFEHRPLLNFSDLKTSPSPALWAFSAWYPLVKIATAGKWRYGPVASATTAVNLRYVQLVSKRVFFIMQLPHKWGGQRSRLLRRWELAPSYFYLSFIDPRAPLGLPQGFLKLNRPTNLPAPHGPTLGELWAYVKANPNEGYWAYCMWLQVTKRWKRLLRFPYQYFVRRNAWQRAYQRRVFYESLDGHRLNFFKPSKVAVFSKLKTTLLSKGKLKKNPFSVLTNFALLANSSRFLTTKTPPEGELRMSTLKSKPKRIRSKALSPLSSIWSTFKSLFKRPL